MAKKLFHASISEEPSTGSVRGKVPALLVRELGATEGSVIEFSVKEGEERGTFRLMTSREARDYKASIGRGSKPAAKPAKGKKEAPVTKKGKKAKKSAKRATKVDYDDDDDDDDEYVAPKKVKKGAKKAKALAPLKSKSKKGKKARK